jgi:hypothetical protein
MFHDFTSTAHARIRSMNACCTEQDWKISKTFSLLLSRSSKMGVVELIWLRYQKVKKINSTFCAYLSACTYIT